MRSHSLFLAVSLIIPLAASAGDDYTVQNYAITQPLAEAPGDAARGMDILAARSRGNCLSCHQAPLDEPFQGNTGPSLTAVAKRYNAAQLRLRLVDPKQINPETMMPAYFRKEGFYRVAPEYADKSILSAQEIEDVIAALMSFQ